MIYCAYGCGQEAKIQLKNSKACCSKFPCQCSILKKKNGDGNRGRKQSSESINKRLKNTKKYNHSIKIKKKLSQQKIEQWKDPDSKFNSVEYRSMLSNRFSKPRTSESYRKSLSNSKLGEKNPMKNPKVASKQGKVMKHLWEDPNSVYHTEEYWKSKSIGENLKPNKGEVKIQTILDKLYSGKWKYTGDYKVWISNKNPDFINEEAKKIIEFFGWVHTEEFRSKYNNDFISNEEHEKERKELFEKNGYKTLIIWEEELSDLGFLKRKILDF